jgi:hypothetical protein
MLGKPSIIAEMSNSQSNLVLPTIAQSDPLANKANKAKKAIKKEIIKPSIKTV